MVKQKNMKIDKYKIYDLVYNLHFPIIFFLFIGSIVITGITGNVLYFVIGTTIAIVLSLLSIYYLYLDFSINKIKLWWASLFKYKLTEEEKPIWDSIVIKEYSGYTEWLEKTKGDDICGPWIKDITPEEVALIDKIHEKFYGKNWWIACPISTAQVCSAKYDDIKNKVIYRRN